MPLYMPEDVRWCATLFDAAARQIPHLTNMARTLAEAPLMHVLRARSIVQQLHTDMRLRTNSREVSTKMRRV